MPHIPTSCQLPSLLYRHSRGPLYRSFAQGSDSVSPYHRSKHFFSSLSDIITCLGCLVVDVVGFNFPWSPRPLGVLKLHLSKDASHRTNLLRCRLLAIELKRGGLIHQESARFRRKLPIQPLRCPSHVRGSNTRGAEQTGRGFRHPEHPKPMNSNGS